MLNFGNQFPFRILFRILSVIVVNCNLIISVKALWLHGQLSLRGVGGLNLEKKHPLPIDLSTENKKAKRPAYEKERRPGRSYMCDLQQKNDVSVNFLNGPTIYTCTELQIKKNSCQTLGSASKRVLPDLLFF
jgi:hypothetical protein